MNTRILMALLLMALGLASCNPGSDPETAQGELSAQEDSHETIKLNAAQFGSSGMELGKMQPHAFYQTVRATGMMDVPPENKASLSAWFGGYVTKISILPGVAVRKGQTLMVLENPEYVQVQQDFLEAKGQLEYLRSDYERQKSLAAANVSSQKQYLKAESDYTVTRVRYEALRKKLSLMSIDADKLREDQLRTEIAVTAPISGFITEVKANVGSYLNPSDVAATIINTDHLHLELNIFEKDFPAVKEGQDIRFHLQSGGGGEYGAHVHLINKTVDPEKRTISIHGHLNEEDQPHAFTPGMYLEAEILTDSVQRPALPSEAVVELDGEHFVLVKKANPGKEMAFERKQVQVGRTDSGYSEVLNHADFGADAEFLVKGAYGLIRDESGGGHDH